jgi:glycosyltransferase involved in cell wall biosynthesis
MKLDIGIASYENPEKLRGTIQNIIDRSVLDWRLLIVDNDSKDPRVRQIIEEYAAKDERVIPRFLSTNTGYAGAVNEFLKWSESEYVVYVDNDAHIQTNGWDEILWGYLARNLELGMVFSGNYNSYEIKRDKYTECLWGTGCFWMLKRLAMADVGLFDEEIGHQNEVDFQTRLRLAGWRMGVAKEVSVQHFATATVSPEASDRIGRGVVEWMNKWVGYFCGKNMNYFSSNVLRFEDWPCNALYLEEYWKLKLPSLNDNPEVVTLDGRQYDLIKVPRLKDFYKGRII